MRGVESGSDADKFRTCQQLQGISRIEQFGSSVQAVDQLHSVLPEEVSSFGFIESGHLVVKVGGFAQAFGMGPVRAHQQGLIGAELLDHFDGVVFGVRHDPDVLFENRARPFGEGATEPADQLAMPRLVSMCRMKSGTHSAPNWVRRC